MCSLRDVFFIATVLILLFVLKDIHDWTWLFWVQAVKPSVLDGLQHILCPLREGLEVTRCTVPALGPHIVHTLWNLDPSFPSEKVQPVKGSSRTKSKAFLKFNKVGNERRCANKVTQSHIYRHLLLSSENHCHHRRRHPAITAANTALTMRDMKMTLSSFFFLFFY